MRSKFYFVVLTAFITFFGIPTIGAEAAEYMVGGPLAGIPLPSLGPYEVELYPNAVERFHLTVGGIQHYSFFDKQSQLRNWIAPNIPAMGNLDLEQFPARRPKVGRPKEAWGDVAVIRCGVKLPVFQLDLGELKPGLYVVRVVAAAKPSKTQAIYDPLFIKMRINDGLKGETHQYKLACNCIDDFYSIAEFYFHSPETRPYHAELFVDEGSVTEPLVHNISLDDVLAGTLRQPIKKRMTLHRPEDLTSLFNATRKWEADQYLKFTPAERIARDEAIWNFLPPINSQGFLGFPPTILHVPGAVADEGLAHAAQNGSWDWQEVGQFKELNPTLGFTLRQGKEFEKRFLSNKQLKLDYSFEDLLARKKLPAPFADDGAGVFRTDPNDPKKLTVYAPIARAVAARFRSPYVMAEGLGDKGAVKMWAVTRNPEYGHDAAISLVRYAYQFPSLDIANYLDTVVSARSRRFEARESRSYWTEYTSYLNAIELYDFLFDYIKGNEELAQAVHRFVPWVKTSNDVIELLDVYLVQTTAKRILRYHYFTWQTGIVTPAVALSEPSVTDPWMDWLFSRTVFTGMPIMGVQDMLVAGYDRHGMSYIGSSSYAQSAAHEAMSVQRYVETAGANPRYDLASPGQYPKVLASCYWPFAVRLGGIDFPRIGDVAGPDKGPLFFLDKTKEAARTGWKISKDPQFAWTLKNYVRRESQSDDEWRVIENAAANVKRAPWLDNRSRSLDNWFSALESGSEHDDHRFRRAAYVRIGQGAGHEHTDTLDLQVISQGVPMTVDGGQRSGYSKPNDRHFSRTHNTVEVNGKSFRGHSWTNTLSDAPGAPYTKVTAAPPEGTKLFLRQFALIDVDEGKGSQPLNVAQQIHTAKLTEGVVPGNSYLFDVFRVSGGDLHTFCFHSMVDDQLQWNAQSEVPVKHVPVVTDIDNDANYLSIFEMSENTKFAGNTPDILEATWRYSRDPAVTGNEQKMLGVNFDETAPRKFNRLHLFDVGGQRVLRADTVCFNPGIPYRFTCTMTQRKGKDLESAYAAIVEPFAGKPFITSRKLIPISVNEKDSQRAVAVELEIRNGRTDICFADGRPEQKRNVGKMQFAGEFAYHSSDEQGLRQATLTGGTLLTSPHVQLTTVARQRTAMVADVDYAKNTVRLDANWPIAAGEVLEFGLPGHQSAFTPISVQRGDRSTTLAFREAPDFLRSEVVRGPKSNQFHVKVMPHLKRIVGYDRDWVISNDERNRFWRADQISDNSFEVKDASFSVNDLGPSAIVRIWSYGEGDTVRQSTHVSLRRISPQVYECVGNVDVKVSLKGDGILVSRDQTTWKPAPESTSSKPWSEISIPATAFLKGPVYLKLKTSG